MQLYTYAQKYSKDAVVCTEFLSLQTLARANAESCYNAILTGFDEQLGLKPQEIFGKLVGFASDGAAVMQGVRSGVAARLKERQPNLTVVHCVAHRLELAIKTAINQSVLYRKLTQFLDNIYHFYHNSTLNCGLLQLTAKVLEISRYIPTRVNGTRWVAHTENGLKNLFSGYPAIVQHLLEVKFLREALKRSPKKVNVHTVQNSQGEQFEVVFISTVRTRHTIAKDDMPSPSSTRQDPDYYGVLSDEGELTTALTRARSLLWVVGDPVSLCSVGKCQKIWKEYIQNCWKLNTLRPTNISWPAIKEKLDMLKQDAPDEEDEEAGGDIATSLMSPTVATEEVEPLQSTISQESDTDAELEEVDEDTFDELMQMWEKEVEKDFSRSDSQSAVEQEEPSNGATGQQPAAQLQPSSRRKRRKYKPAYGMQHDEEDKVIWIKLETNFDYSKLVGAHDKEVEEGPEELDDVKRAQNIRLAKTDPENYCIAVLQFAENRLVHAIPLESHSHEKIVISCKRNRKNALDGDQVVLHKWKKRDVIYGEVMCVLKRAEDLKWKKIVCAIDPENVDLMCPVDNEFLPKMYIYPKGVERSENGSVTFGLYHIYQHRERKIREKSITVKLAEMPHKLFVVRYFRWGDTFAYPLGVVTEELPPCNSFENGLKVLRMKHGVREKWPELVKDEIKHHLYHEKWEIPKEEFKARKANDLRAQPVFTIGRSDLHDRDSALHIEKLQNGNVKLGFHLADVPFFVEKGSNMDEEALRRGCSFFDIQNKHPSHMLPDLLSTNLCIFKENTERLALSFILTLSLGESLHVEKVDMCRSIVCCKQNLTFERVESYLLNEYDSSFELHGEVMQQIELLYKVMRHRPHTPQMYCEAKIEDQVNFPLAYALVEGVRKLVNVEVSKKLNNLAQQNIPVCLQLPPKEEEMMQWYQTFEEDAHRIPHLPKSDLCERKKAAFEEPIPVLQLPWERVGQILKCGKDKILELKKLLGCSEIFPKQVAALANLSNIIPQEEYTFTSTGNGEMYFPHFSLQEEQVHPFMSPVRSFMDLMVLRMLVALLENVENPYSNDDLTHITYHCTKQTHSAQKYKKMAQVLELAFDAKDVPHHLQAVIHSADEDELILAYPFKGFLEVIKSLTGVPLRLLKPADRPADGDIRGKSVELNWKNRIYNYNGTMIDSEDNTHEVPNEGEPQSDLWLLTDSHIRNMPASYWEKMMQSVDHENYENLRDLEESWKQPYIGRSQSEGKTFVKDVTCEKRSMSQVSAEVKKYVKFFRKYNPGDVLDVQLCSGMQQGCLTPGVQLVKMTATYDLCLEHRNMPVECFTELAERMPPICPDVKTYVDAWLPMLKMMVAYNTIISDETIVIHNVLIRWSKEFLRSSREIYGHFSLEKKWCDDRQILFSPLPRLKGSPRGLFDDAQKFLVSDYICVRFKRQGRKVEHASHSHSIGPQQDESFKTEVQAPMIVVHGVAGVTNVGRPNEEDNYDVMFQVTHTSCDILKCVFDENGGRDTLCSVELIPKSESEKRMEAALMDVENSSDLIHSIILQNPDGMEKYANDDRDMQLLLNEGSKINHKAIKKLFHLHPPNQFQSKALRIALSQPFTVIQGPPGTGKTRTGAYITAFFAKFNRELFHGSGDGRRQILYCGPSNKSVDVIAQFLQKLPNSIKPSFVRVYGDAIEQQIFPVPGVEGAERKFTYFEERHMPEEVKKNALHHLIRSEAAGEDGKAIRDMDRKFKEGKLEPSLSVVRHYKFLVRKTKIKMLRARDVILCTCNAAGHFILKEKGTLNIVQCIIDEAGMCFELDNLIPLVCHGPKQVVLIGDHKQLRPIIQHPRAKLLGAEVSLMEKHENSAYTIRTQYRMHEEICRFPSEEFYDSSLITDKSVRNRIDFLPKEIWPGTRHHPRAFCHIMGEEYAQTILTSDGGELSKSNEKEACEVVRIAKYLVEKLHVNRENLVVLSQYKLQCSLLREKLRGLRVNVQTIIKSQGSEWDFVLLSTVRSLPDDEIPERPGRSWRRKYLGYIEDENQMNVGITRARQGLIIVGNKYLLATCNKWKKLIQHYENTGSVVDAENFLKQPRS